MQQGLAHTKTLVFTNPKRVGWAAAGALGVGGLLLLFIAVVFIVLVNLPANSKTAMMPGILGGFMVLPLLSIWYGVSLLRSPVRVLMDSTHLIVEGLVSRRTIEWTKVAKLKRDKTPAMANSPFVPVHKRPTHDVLVVVDDLGRDVVRLTSAISGFPVLVEEVELRSSAARGGPTYDRAAQIKERRVQLRRSARKAAILGGLLAALGLGAAVFFILEARAESRLKREGVTVTAKIEKREMVRATPRLTYSFADAAGVGRVRDAMMEEEAWEHLKGATHVQIRYLAADSSRSRLVRGEVVDEGPPLPLLLGGAAFMALLGGVMLLLPRLGVADVKIDRGGLKLVRFTDVDDGLESEGEEQDAALLEAAPAGRPLLAPRATYAPGPAQAPGIATLGAISIILGVWGFGLNSVRLVGVFMLRRPGTVMAGPLLTGVTWGTAWVLSLSILAAGIGLTSRRRWGRALALPTAAAQCVLAMVMIVNVLWINPFQPVAGDSQAQSQAWAATAGGVVGPLLGAVFPVVLLVVLGKRAAAESLR